MLTQARTLTFKQTSTTTSHIANNRLQAPLAPAQDVHNHAQFESIHVHLQVKSLVSSWQDNMIHEAYVVDVRLFADTSKRASNQQVQHCEVQRKRARQKHNEYGPTKTACGLIAVQNQSSRAHTDGKTACVEMD